MPPVLTPEQMPDAVIQTLKKLNKGKWIGHMTDIQNHIGVRNIVKNKKIKLDGSTGYTIRHVTSPNGTAKHTGLFGKVEFNKDDALEEGEVGYCYTDATMIFDRRSNAMNSGPEKVVDATKMERARALTDIVEISEKDIWGKPTDSNDNSTPFGFKYWLTKNAALGFNGGNPSGFSSGRAGIDTSSFPRYANYTGGYTEVSDAEGVGLIFMMERGAYETKWVAPAPEPGMAQKGLGRGIFTNFKTWYKMKRVAKSNNDSLGWDVATRAPLFRGSQILAVPYLDDDSTNPVYMIDFSHMFGFFLKDWMMKEIRVDQLPDRPHCFGIVISMVWNVVCTDLRKQAVFYDAS